MRDVFDKLAADIKRDIIAICAKVAELHRVSRVENEYQRGYNAAATDIAAKIREL